MKYIPPEVEEEVMEESSFHPERIPSSETTKMLRWGTTVEPDDIIEKQFIERNRNMIGSINKWMPLSNYDKEKYQKQIEHIRRFQISMFEKIGLYDDAEKVVISSWGDSNYSRGRGGFFTKEQNMLRYKIQKEQENKKEKGGFSFFKNKEPDKPPDHEINWR